MVKIVIHHIPLRFGYSTRRELSPEGADIAAAVCRAYFGDAQLLSAPIEWLSTNFRIAPLSLAELLESATNVLASSQNLLIDVGGRAHFDPIDPEVHYGLAKFISGDNRQRFGTVLIVCSGRLVAGSPESAAYRAIADTPNTTMVFTDGNDVEASDVGGKPRRSSAHLKHRVAAVREIYASHPDNLRGRFTKAVIRRPGFSRGPGGANIAFTYDFSNGNSLAFELCRKQVDSLADKGVGTVLYRADRSWFAHIVEDACSGSEKTIDSFPLAADQGVADVDCGEREYALFSPVVRSGSQFRKLLADIDLAPRHLWCLGSIDEGNCHYVDERTRKLSVSRSDGSVWNLDLNFEVSIKPPQGLVPTLWRSLSGNFDTADFTSSKYPLSAPAAWAMMLEADFGAETYGPDRDLLGVAPDFESLVRNNAPYLAQMFRDEIRRIINRPLSQNDLVLCADEPAAKRLAQEIVGSAYEKSIVVSRPLLNALKNAGGAGLDQHTSELVNEVNSLSSQIQYARTVLGLRGSRKVPAIIFDETVVSGSTVLALTRLADNIGLDIQAAISILQLCETLPSLSFPLKSLYRIPMPDYLWK